MADVSKQFARRVKALRLQKKMSQGDLAEAIGVHPTYISGIERGIRNMTLKNIAKLAKGLGVSAADLVR